MKGLFSLILLVWVSFRFLLKMDLEWKHIQEKTLKQQITLSPETTKT